MVLFVVKILAAGVRWAMDSDVFASILPMQFGKFRRILKSFEISVNISSVVEGICCAVQVTGFLDIHVAVTILIV